MLRTHTCGTLTKKELGKKVILCGWIDSLRSHGKIGFITLRDRYGMTQLFFSGAVHKELESLRKETVLQIGGVVNARPAKLVNNNLSTGEVEVEVHSLNVLNLAEPLPLQLDEHINSSDETRLTYRFLDLRKARLQHNLKIRHNVLKAIHEYLDKHQFLHIETPILAKSTPEGARDYLVPSRLHKGNFYALPQSPQLFKQLLMVAGYDRYYQIARCFRDEDLRADRQPEFTQLDIEMSFIEQEDMYALMEGLMVYIWKTVLGISLKIPFPRMTYDDAIKKYQRDNPDLRKKKDDWAFVWILDFPLFEWNKEDKRWYAVHHPFTSPQGNIDFKNLGKIKAKAYDLVLNGSEIGGGSMRIHDRKTQMELFKVLGISEEEAEEKFGFLLKAFQYGAPPHGGIAFGIDRLTALLCGEESIREVIAFPKNKDAQDLMLDAPSSVSKEQLDELGLLLEKDLKEYLE